MDKKSHLMTAIARWIVDRRRLIMIIFVALAALSVYTSTLVVTNDSLEHFLPADTETRLGLDIMDREFVTYDTAQIVVPIIADGVQSTEAYINPLPASLVLTGIVVSVSVTAIMLSLTVRLYMRYHTLNLDEIYRMADHLEDDR